MVNGRAQGSVLICYGWRGLWSMQTSENHCGADGSIKWYLRRNSPTLHFIKHLKTFNFLFKDP